MTTLLNSRLAVVRLVFWAMLVGVISGSAKADNIIIDTHFDTDSEGFSYADDLFRGTSQPAYASGSYSSSGGASGGGLSVTLGNVDSNTITGMSGGWQGSFTVPADQELELGLSYNLTQAGTYESDELSQLIVEVDGQPLSGAGADYIIQLAGDGNSGPDIGTGWIRFTRNLGVLSAGAHTLTIGAYNSKKTLNDEFTDLLIDDVRIASPAPPDPGPQALVDALDLDAFKQNIEFLSSPDPPINGSRHWTQPGNQVAVDWIKAELESYGYTNVVLHPYTYSGQTRYNVYATKIGATHPDEMYIVGAHLDSKTTDGSGDAAAAGADDDASGTSLVLEAARVFANPAIETDYSIRFTLWNNEETGLIGSKAYVADRQALRGIESPPGSGEYPEPVWRGMIQHDMILYDHGIPPQADQLPAADVDIEYNASATFGGAAIALADAALGANVRYATDYPAEVTDEMSNTDSAAFESYTAAISLRENRRLAELGSGSNPYYHKATDLYGNYSEADYLFGFNAAQTTVGTVAELAGARLVNDCGNGTLDSGEQCDDGNTAPGDCCAATCQFEAEGSSCEDGDLCSENDSCNASGSCTAGTPLSCDDGLFCNGPETCSSTVGCQSGTPPILDDGVSCTVDSCDEGSDTIVNAPLDSICDNGQFCDGPEICHATLDCQAGAPPVVADGVSCTADSCDEVNDVILHAPDHGACDNGLYCDGAEVCDVQLDCQAGTAPVVDDAVGCTTDSCDEVNNVVVHLPDHGACNNGLYCDGAEVCDVQLDCQAGTPLVISDSVGCTVDACDEANDIIVHTADDSSCDNGQFCDGVETCDAIDDCQAGTAPVVADAVGCTVDSCDEVNDIVVHAPDDLACDNGLYCDGAEVCDSALDCQAGTAPVIDDAVGCTVDSCDEVNDVVVHAPDDASCDNSLYCDGPEVCDVQLDCRAGSPPVVDDAVGCTTDACDEVNDLVVHVPNDATCDDGLYCDGAESCDALLDCQAGTPPVLDDGVSCTIDICDEATDSAIHTPDDGVCDNGQFCDGAESCDLASDCQSGTAPELDDGVGCTVDSCDEVGDSVVHAATDALCDNGEFCDGSELCDALLDCQEGTAPAVDDGVGCTVDSCDEATDSIVHAADDAFCDNGVFCDGAESCDTASDCQGGADPCGGALCDEPSSQCGECFADSHCDNGLYCDGAETCVGNVCLAGPPVVCDDGVACTVDSCDEAGESCQSVASDALCENGEFCDGAETCDLALGCLGGSDPCEGAACDEFQDICELVIEPRARIETGTLTVGGSHVSVPLVNAYASPVVVCSVQYHQNAAPVVARVSNVTSTSFDVRLQNPSDGPVAAESVDYVVVEEGVWTIEGRRLEAWAYQSTVTDSASSWVGEVQGYGQSYSQPVVLGQVMTESDADWSVFWARGSSRTDPPSPTDLWTGKTVGEDGDTVRVDETIGVVVFEAGHGTIAGAEFEASLSGDSIRGVGASPPYLYSFDAVFASLPEVAVVTMAGMDGNNGGWAQTHGPTQATTTALFLSIDEDQVADSERSHTTEQVAYVAFEGAFAFEDAPECALAVDCDDGLFCNGDEDCVAGVCRAGSAIACDDGVGCTIDACNEASDGCEHAPSDSFCDDALFCDGFETCHPLLGCQAGTPVSCDDAVGCTVDSCNEAADACDATPDDGYCDNTLFCDGAEACDAVLGCQGGSDPCPGLGCSEGNDLCVECFVDADCPDAGNLCTDELCNGGLCESIPNALPCDDGIDCTYGDQCADGACQGTGLDHGLCDNDRFCDGVETCDAALGCQAGLAPCANPAACDEVDDICLDLEVIVLEADFDADAGGFGYLDDAFRGTSQPAYASGAWLDTSGYIGGALSVTLGGIDNAGIAGMSGGWWQTFSLDLDTELELRLRYNLTQTSEYESNELSQVMVTLDGVPLGSDGYDYVAEIQGDGNGGPARSTGWVVFRAELGFVSAGVHTITIGGYNSKKTYNNESTTVLLDDLRVGTPEPFTAAQLRMEAESFDERSSSAIDAAEWLIAPDEVDAADDVYSAAEGICNADGIPRYLVSLPDQGLNHSADPFGNGPVVSYAFEIVEAAAYRIWVRAAALDGTSDSFYLRIRELDGAEWWRWNPLGTGADLTDQWQGSGAFGTCTAADPAASCTGFEPMAEVLAAGSYHLDIAMREDGSALDAIILDSTGGFDGTDLAAQSVPCAAP